MYYKRRLKINISSIFDWMTQSNSLEHFLTAKSSQHASSVCVPEFWLVLLGKFAFRTQTRRPVFLPRTHRNFKRRSHSTNEGISDLFNQTEMDLRSLAPVVLLLAFSWTTVLAQSAAPGVGKKKKKLFFPPFLFACLLTIYRC